MRPLPRQGQQPEPNLSPFPFGPDAVNSKPAETSFSLLNLELSLYTLKPCFTLLCNFVWKQELLLEVFYLGVSRHPPPHFFVWQLVPEAAAEIASAAATSGLAAPATWSR